MLAALVKLERPRWFPLSAFDCNVPLPKRSLLIVMLRAAAAVTPRLLFEKKP
jgi:hypothetical protein